MSNAVEDPLLQPQSKAPLESFQIQNPPQQKTYQNRRHLIPKVMVLCISTYYYGYTLSNLSSFNRETIQTVYGTTAARPSIWGTLIGIMQVGAMIGAGISPFIMKFFSRKHFVLLINLVALILSLVIQINTLGVLLFCRIAQGILTGCYMSIIPIYINELCPKQIVGVFGVFTQIFVVLAQMTNYAIGVVLIDKNMSSFAFFRIMVSYDSLLILIQSFLLIVDYIPQSPNHLIKQRRNLHAREVISLFTVPEHVDRTFQHKKMEVKAESQGRNSQWSQRTNQQKIVYPRRAYLLGFQIPFMMQMTGINGVMTSANSIVAQVVPDLAQYTGLTITSIRLIATMFTLPILAYFGRKPLALFGNLTLGIIDISLGFLFILEGWSLSGNIIFFLLIVYVIVFGLSLGPVTWLYIPEIVPAKVAPLATMMTWLGASISTILIPVIIEANDGNPYPVFFIFGVVTLLFYLVNRKWMVETKGKTTLQIAKLLST